jgi:iron(III) transport system permease protein
MSASPTTHRLWRLAGSALALIVALPIFSLLLQWFTLGNGEQEIWQHLFNTKLERLAFNTVLLLVGVAAGVAILGVSLASLVSLCEFPGRRHLEWALLLPLAVPGYVMAFVFLGLFNFAGPVQSLWRQWFSVTAWFPDVQGAGFVITVFTLVLYPYVYLLTRTALLTQGRNLIDVARVLGLSPTQAYWRVVLPVARPAIVGGVALVLMETLADFGAVSVFNYDTFTTAIYGAWSGLFNLAVAAQLATLLLVFVLIALLLEHYSRRGARFSRDERSRPVQRFQLQGVKALLASGYGWLVVAVAFVLPVSRLVVWVIDAGVAEYDARYPEFLLHTVELAAMAAVIAVASALLLGLLQRLPASKAAQHWQRLCTRIATLGYALPGSVLAVGILLVFTAADSLLALLGIGTVLVGTMLSLLLAYQTRFLAVAQTPVDNALERVRPSLIEAARSLGVSGAPLLRRLYIPLLWPGLTTAALLVFVDVMKEMPATLILRPYGWDTLAVRIYQMTAEGQWPRAALPALTLLLVGLVPVILLLKHSHRARS